MVTVIGYQPLEIILLNAKGSEPALMLLQRTLLLAEFMEKTALPTECEYKGKSSSCKTQITCYIDGTDSVCIFASNTNRQRECADDTATNSVGGITSHSGCLGFAAMSKRTSNRTFSIALAACMTYTSEASCIEETDGACIWYFLWDQLNPL